MKSSRLADEKRFLQKRLLSVLEKVTPRTFKRLANATANHPLAREWTFGRLKPAVSSFFEKGLELLKMSEVPIHTSALE